MRNYLIYLLLIFLTLGFGLATQIKVKQRWILWTCLWITATALTCFVWTISEPPYGSWFFSDFTKAYYVAGREVLHHWFNVNPTDIYEGVKKFVNIPILTLFFVPFGFFSASVASVLMGILSAIAIIGTCYFIIIKTGISGYRRLVLIGLFAINGPLHYSIRIGNSTHLMLLSLIGAIFCLQTKRHIWVGILLAVTALFKVPLLLLGIYFVFRQQWKIVSAFVGTLIAAGISSILLFGWNLHLVWFQQCIQPYLGKPVGAYNVQSVDGFLVRLLTGGTYLYNWDPIITLDWQYKLLRYMLLSLIVGGTAWVFWRSGQPKKVETQVLEFSTTLCLALVISPISWTHYYLLMLIPLCLYVGEEFNIPQTPIWKLSIFVSALLISFPVLEIIMPKGPILKALVQRLLYSHYFLGGVLLLAILLAGRWHATRRVEAARVEQAVL